ncbi:sulfate transporter [Ectopseudomonas toyotomiensis]|uniref:Uncharacterized protein n=1 Tax=Ectopseudomonas toyotomiensis TaxID=554344 RepID=A0A1I5M319_9GAMM|nr:DUF3164 family protein [Pseudomonas toyotomiensis]PIA66160.1 sulfate transporter [Pseudomonas toyotomiensis]SFP03952.1 Protein of unknown function [Pseudomonas toyotomiensis]SFP97504.1 Protein of unknown function [Pseudomonas toyotomiensis]
MAEQIQVPEGWLRNAAGGLQHESEIREQDKMRDMVVMGIVKDAVRLHEELKALKKRALEEIDDLVTIAGEKFDMKLGGPKGNVSLISFDGRYKVKRVYSNVQTFTEEMEVAKVKVFECISRWGKTVSEDAHRHLFTLATNAFRLTRQGEISLSRVQEMTRVDIDDEDWKKAMEAVKDSIIVNGKAVYIQVQERVGEKAYRTILLDIAGV